MKRIVMMLALTALTVVAMSLSAVTALAASAAKECAEQGGTFTQDGGTKRCTTVDSPGNSQGNSPVGSTDVDEGQGNLENDNPEPQDIEDECTQRPPKAQGNFACP